VKSRPVWRFADGKIKKIKKNINKNFQSIGIRWRE